MKSLLIKKLTMALLTLGLSATTAPPTFAGASLNTIDPVALVTENGRHILVTGPIVCTAGELATLRVTVTQRVTGAVAQGRVRLTCTGAFQNWAVPIARQGRGTFQNGPATAVALARTSVRGAPTDAHQWLVELTLSGQGTASLQDPDAAGGAAVAEQGEPHGLGEEDET
jgi:hypothetical protein